MCQMNRLTGGCYLHNVIPYSWRKWIQLRTCLHRLFVITKLLRYPKVNQIKVYSVLTEVKVNCGWETVETGAEQNILDKSITATYLLVADGMKLLISLILIIWALRDEVIPSRLQ